MKKVQPEPHPAGGHMTSNAPPGGGSANKECTSRRRTEVIGRPGKAGAPQLHPVASPVLFVADHVDRVLDSTVTTKLTNSRGQMGQVGQLKPAGGGGVCQQ